MKKINLLLILLIILCNVFAQQNNPNLVKGNEAYKKGDYSSALTYYNACLESNKDITAATFNLSLTAHKLKNSGMAIELLDNLIKTGNRNDNSTYWYNKGVILTQAETWDLAIEAYKQALRENPGNEKARDNLQKALQQLPKPTPPPKQSSQKKEAQNKQPPPPRMSERESEQRLKQLEQKEKELQKKMQEKKSSAGGGNKDW